MNLSKYPFAIVAVILFFVLNNSCKLNPYIEGKQLYNAYCSSCHMENGTGLHGIYPDLNKGSYTILRQNSLACIIRHGIISDNNAIPRANMPANPRLSAIEISNMVNYINTSFLNQKALNIIIINNQLKSCNNVN